MTIKIDRGEITEAAHADRSGSSTYEHPEVQGFYFSAPSGLSIEFEDERDAERMARKILYRIGYDLPAELLHGNRLIQEPASPD